MNDLFEQLEGAPAIGYKGVIFEEWVIDKETGAVYGELCACCAEKYKDLFDELTKLFDSSVLDELADEPTGVCSVSGCHSMDDEARYYVAFQPELIQVLEKDPIRELQKFVGKKIMAYEELSQFSTGEVVGKRGRSVGVVAAVDSDGVQMYNRSNPGSYRLYTLTHKNFKKWLDEGLYKAKSAPAREREEALVFQDTYGLSKKRYHTLLNLEGLSDDKIVTLIQENGVPEVEKGYCSTMAYGSSEIIDGAIHVEKIDELDTFLSDWEACRQAEKDGVKFINDMDGLEKGLYIDTPENRAICEEALREHPEYRIENWIDTESEWGSRYVEVFGELEKENAHVSLEEQIASVKEKQEEKKTAQDVKRSINELEVLAKDEDELIREDVAKDLNCSEELFKKLATDDCWFVKYAVEHNENCPEYIKTELKLSREKLWREHQGRLPILNDDEKMELASADDVPAHVLRELAEARVYEVRASVAMNRNTSEDVLRQLATDPVSFVREGLAENRNTPEDVLRSLAKDPDSSVRQAAAKNPRMQGEKRGFEKKSYER